jgi:ion channel-forming bestrophin family protein
VLQHSLRGELGIYYEDLYPLITFLPRHTVHPSFVPTAKDVLPIWIKHDKLSQSARASPSPSPASTLTSKRHQKSRNGSFDPEKALPRVNSDVPLRGARNPPQPTVYEIIPLLVIFRPIVEGPKWLYRRMFKKRTVYTSEPEEIGGDGISNMSAIETNVPLEITMFLHSYLQFVLKKGHLSTTVASGFVANLSALQDTVTNLDRVRNTPIPFAYQVRSTGSHLVS